MPGFLFVASVMSGLVYNSLKFTYLNIGVVGNFKEFSIKNIDEH